jgi:transposase
MMLGVKPGNRTQNSVIGEFRKLAFVLRRDPAAVEAALTYEWSNGQTEGEGKTKGLKSL